MRALEVSQSTWYLGLKLRRKIWARDTFRRITSTEIASLGKKEHCLTVQDEKTGTPKSKQFREETTRVHNGDSEKEAARENEIQTLEPNA